MNTIYHHGIRSVVLSFVFLTCFPSVKLPASNLAAEGVSSVCPEVIIINEVVPLPTGYIILDVNNDTVAMSALGAPLTSCNLNIGEQYRLRPYRPGVFMDDVSTFDILNIQRHLLGHIPLVTMDRIIAGDANYSNTLSISDILNIQAKIFDQPVVPAQTVPTWQFVSKDFVDNFPLIAPYLNMAFTYTGPGQVLEIIEVKTGRSRHESRYYETNFPYKGTLFFELDDIYCLAGEEYTVDVRVLGFTNIRGFQLALNVDPSGMECLDVLPKEVNHILPKLGLDKIGNGVVRANWVLGYQTDMDVADGEAIFELKVKALQDGKLSTFIDINSTIMRAEGYDKFDDFYHVDIKYIPKFKGNTTHTNLIPETLPNADPEFTTTSQFVGSPSNQNDLFLLSDGVSQANAYDAQGDAKAAQSKPIADCVDYLEVSLMPSTALAVISANEIESGNSFDPSTPYEDLVFKIELAKSIKEGQMVPGAGADEFLTIDCSYMPPNAPSPLVDVTLWVGNKEGEWDNCTSTIYLNEKYGVCCMPGIIMIEVVQVNGEQEGGDLCSITTIHSTNGMDTISIPCANQGGVLGSSNEHIVEPYLNTGYLWGTSTYDLLLISKHLTGTKIFDNPYKRIAADINNDCKISISDLIELRRLILIPGLKLKNNTSWRFVDADYVFPNPEKPCNFNETITFSGMLGVINIAKFYAIKIGDINYGYTKNDLTGDDVSGEVRGSSPPIELTVPNLTFESNSTIQVPLTLNTSSTIEGFQYTLRFDPDRLMFEGLDVHGSVLEEEDFGLSWVAEGIILVSWIGDEASMETGFSLQFKTKTSGKISEVISLSNKYLRAEAYSMDETIHPITLAFEESMKADKIHSISPNPFQSDLKIKVQLRTEGDILLSFSDVLGHVFYQQKAQGNRGMNDIHVDGSLWPSGAIFCKIEQHGHQEVKLLFKKA
ncbi:MAG: hypothetical protein KA479_04140 [Saprospiraceae bacterium]|nr:hypothetical protein [Saprospiraceae bacterium]